VIANIGPAGQRRRFLSGLVGLAAALFLMAILIAGQAPRPWRALLVLPFWAAGLGLLQAREKT